MNCSMTIGGILGYCSDLTLFHEQGRPFIVMEQVKRRQSQRTDRGGDGMDIFSERERSLYTYLFFIYL